MSARDTNLDDEVCGLRALIVAAGDLLHESEADPGRRPLALTLLSMAERHLDALQERIAPGGMALRPQPGCRAN